MEMHAEIGIGKPFEGLGWAVWRGKEPREREKERQSPSSKFIDLRMERDSWQIFSGQEIILSLL